jgi:citrate synthase
VEASSKEAGENEIKKKAMASGDSKLLHYANAELRKWKTEIRWETVKMLLAYQKMDKSIQFEKFVEENASSKLVAEKKHNGLIQSLGDVPMPKDVAELVLLLVEKMSEYKHHQQVRQHV